MYSSGKKVSQTGIYEPTRIVSTVAVLFLMGYGYLHPSISILLKITILMVSSLCAVERGNFQTRSSLRVHDQISLLILNEFQHNN